MVSESTRVPGGFYAVTSRAWKIFVRLIMKLNSVRRLGVLRVPLLGRYRIFTIGVAMRLNVLIYLLFVWFMIIRLVLTCVMVRRRHDDIVIMADFTVRVICELGRKLILRSLPPVRLTGLGLRRRISALLSVMPSIRNLW